MEPSPEIDARLQIALSAALDAGRLTLDYFQRDDLQVERKADSTPVTAADRQAEMLLRERISAEFPEDAILGEEFGEQPGRSGYRWVLDPIDGTKSFICGVPLYGTLVGVEREGRSLAGVICIPALGECVYAAAGRGAWYLRGDASARPAQASRRSELDGAVFLTSQLDTFTERQALEVYFALERRAGITRTWGDCYGYLLVATGRADVMLDPVVSPWDAAALQPILEESGGAFADWQGRPTFLSGHAIGCSRALLDQVLAVTRPFAPADRVSA